MGLLMLATAIATVADHGISCESRDRAASYRWKQVWRRTGEVVGRGVSTGHELNRQDEILLGIVLLVPGLGLVGAGFELLNEALMSPHRRWKLVHGGRDPVAVVQRVLEDTSGFEVERSDSVTLPVLSVKLPTQPRRLVPVVNFGYQGMSLRNNNLLYFGRKYLLENMPQVFAPLLKEAKGRAELAVPPKTDVRGEDFRRLVEVWIDVVSGKHREGWR